MTAKLGVETSQLLLVEVPVIDRSTLPPLMAALVRGVSAACVALPATPAEASVYWNDVRVAVPDTVLKLPFKFESAIPLMVTDLDPCITLPMSW